MDTPPRPTIRYLTPADYPDMCDILDQHTNGLSAYCNDRNAPPSADFNWQSKWYIDTMFEQAMTSFFGYFDEQGRLAAFCCLIRWNNSTDVTISVRVENPSLNLPRADGARWSDASIDVVNWAVGLFWTEGVTTFWVLNVVGQEAAAFPAHPNSLLNQYEREKVMDLPAGQLPPEQYRRVCWMPIFYDAVINKYTDPLPLQEYLKVTNDQA